MSPCDSATVFRAFLADRGIDADTAGLAQTIEGGLNFYENVRATSLAPCRQADMLLFQFGVYDWGKGEHFEIDLTRQFIIDGAEGDDAISQLGCTVLYEPTAALRAIGAADRWCEGRDDLAQFRAFIVSSAAYKTALRFKPTRTKIDWSPV